VSAYEEVNRAMRGLLKEPDVNRFVPAAKTQHKLLAQWQRRTKSGRSPGPIPDRMPTLCLPAVETYRPYSIHDSAHLIDQSAFSVVSLFAGAGGSSLGYRLSSGRVHAAVEFGPAACASYRRNHRSTLVVQRNIRDVLNEREGVERLLGSTSLSSGTLDLLDASPPCTEFSVAGKGIGDQTIQKAHSGVKQTNVATLPFDYAHFLHKTRARTSVMENVPGLVSMTPGLFERILDALRFNHGGERSYYVGWKMLSASDYGVPQKRVRVIVISVRKDVAESVGINCDHDVARIFPRPTSGLVTIRSALTNLVQDIRDTRPFVRAMRLSSTRQILAELSGSPTKHRRLRDATTNFSLVRCSWDLPAPTLVIAAQHPDGRPGAIHPTEDRKFSVPELKRLTGLPDDFVLVGTISQAVEAVCNMVPPFLTKAIGKSIYEHVLKPYHERYGR